MGIESTKGLGRYDQQSDVWGGLMWSPATASVRLSRELSPTLVESAEHSQSENALRVRAVTTIDGLRKLDAHWGRLLSGCPIQSPFMSHAWALTWYECFGQDQELLVLVVEDDEGPCAMAPLVRAHRRLGPLTYRSLELIGTGPLRYLGMGLSDRSDFLLARRPDESIEAILRHLAAVRDSWDIVDLRFVPETSSTLRVTRRLAPDLHLGHAEALCSESPYLTLDGGFEPYMKRRSRNFRNGIRRKERRLSEAGNLMWQLDAGEMDPDRALDHAFAVSDRSWKARHGSGLFTHPSIRSFFKRLAPRMTSQGSMSIAVATLSDQPIAYEILFRAGDELWSYDHGYEEGMSAYSPGHLLTGHIVEQACEDGIAGYDFLRGDEEYKLRWLAELRREQQLILDSGSMTARAIRKLNHEAKWLLKRSASLIWLQARAAGLANRLSNGRREEEV